MQKDDINTGLLAYPTLQGPQTKELLVQQPTNSIYHQISLLDLGQYRIKSHCHYDSQSVSTTEYSIFQIEILDNELQRHYQGRFILEIWNKQGERIFQKVVQEELTTWKLYNNVFIFKAAAESPLIYVVWLHKRKMAAIKHPYDDHKEIDLIYYDGYLIVAQAHNFRFTQIAESDVQTTIGQFMNPDEAMSPLIEKDFSGIIQNDRILSIIPNPTRHELFFICASENYQILYFKFNVNKQNEKRQVALQKIEQDPKKKTKLDKKQAKLLENLADIQQIVLVNKSGIPYLLVLRKNAVLEVIENFSNTVYAEQRLNLTKILPSFGDKITFQYSDGSINQHPALDKLSEKAFISDQEYNRQQAQPPQGTAQHEIHRFINFYQDVIAVNQSLFIVRDNIIFIVDTFTKNVVQKFTQKQQVVSLHKLKQQSDDDKGYKVTTYKVVAVHRNGSLQVFVPADNNLMTDWQKTDLANTPMVNIKEPVVSAFQNQSSLNNLYIQTQNNDKNTFRLFQMMFNTQIIDFSNLKLAKGDLVFNVSSISRQREMIAIVDVKYLTVYRNDKGNLIKLYQLNHTRHDLKENITPQSVWYFSKDYVLILTKKLVFKINLATSAVDSAKLTDNIRLGGHVFLDASTFYFLTDADEDGSTKLAVIDTGMIEAAFSDKNKDEAQNAIVDKDKAKGQTVLMYPTWTFKHPVKRIDFDEFNSLLTLQQGNHDVTQIPLFHRNTQHFIGMAERTFYICFKKHGDMFYALDKANYVNCWSMNNGQLLSRRYVHSFDYKLFEVDREVYDKNWFKFTLIYRDDVQQSPQEQENQAVIYRTYKIVDIDDKGNVFEWLNFIHPFQKNMDCHLYFNTDFNVMIEVLLNKSKQQRATYNYYVLENALSQKWKFEKTFNQADGPSLTEWHSKTLYPFNLNEKTFEELKIELFNQYDTYKLIGQDKIKILNTQDGIEMVFESANGRLDAFMALQYSFANTKDSFYDKKCGHFYIQEVTSRLQNFYEAIRRQIFLQNKTNIKLSSLDVSARDFKYKYVIEQSYTQFDNQFFNQYFLNNEKKLLKIFKQMSNDQIQRLVHNVFPEGGNTIMHFIANTNLGFESVDFIGRLSKKEGFVVPFLINFDQLTPLDIMMNNKDFKQVNSMMKLLQKTPMDHHSRLITHQIPKLIEISLPQLQKYFDKRKFQTGVCKAINVGRLRVAQDKDFKTVTTTLINDNSQQVQTSLMNQKFKEVSIQLEVLDIPLYQYKVQDIKEKQQLGENINDYEIKLVKSFAATENLEIFNQRATRAYIDFLWPYSRNLIIKNLFLPYLAFILYYMFYLMVLKKLNVIQQIDPQFYQFTSGMMAVYNVLFKFILFLGCFYFLYQDFLQIRTLPNNRIVLWTYANVVPLALMIFIIIFDTLVKDSNDDLNKTFYSASAFFVWIRVVHLLKLFSHTSYLLRMASRVIYRIRWLICFIIISLLAFGYTFFFISDINGSYGASIDSPTEGIENMFYVLIGRYDVGIFSNPYLSILLVVISCFNFFFIFTLLIALSVVSFNQDQDVNSIEAYSDKASIMALYSYLLTETAVREPAKKYLLIATVTENKKGKVDQFGQNGGDMRTMQAKMIKNLDRRMNNLTSKVEKTLKDIQDRLDNVQQRND